MRLSAICEAHRWPSLTQSVACPRRVLHGRNQFTADSNGVRHLQGTYVNIDDAHCRFNALRLRFAPNSLTIKNRRVANGNYA